ncbi:Protein angel 2, partial [Mortierella alpina]
TVSIVTYNLLSATLASTDRKFVGAGYAPGQLSWKERFERLVWEILLLEADIVCVQELDERNYRIDFGPTMATFGYAGVFQKRRWDLAYGFAIFLKKARVTLVRECPVPCPQGELVRDIDHAGLMLVVKVAGTPGPRRMCVATTHILNGEDIGWRRLGQLMSIMAAAEIQLRQHPRMPIVLTGDFNAKLSNYSTKFVRRGGYLERIILDYGSLESIIIGWVGIPRCHSDEDVRKFKEESWEVRQLVDPSAFATEAQALQAQTMAQRSDLVDRLVSHSVRTASAYSLANIVDHIFYGQIGDIPLMTLVARLELPESLAQLKNGLPAAHLGSDHFALGAKFCLLNEADEAVEAEDEEEEMGQEEEYLRLLDHEEDYLRLEQEEEEEQE